MPDLYSITIPTYVINLPERTERLAHITQQFENRPEFDVTIIEACRHEVGALGLFQSMRKIIELAMERDDDVIIICEDDHEFTPDYSREYLLKNIIEAHYQGVDILSGGSGKIDQAVPVTENRYWVALCLSTQFIVVYRSFFQRILDEPFDRTVIADQLFSTMTGNKMVLYPFVSQQKDFGYSDVTPVHNERQGLVQRMFAETAARLDVIRQVYTHYQSGAHLI
ncbi:glycosyl transferase [Chitinophaga sp. Mgbs1]|uniref:Glycosyl transferase n=1 Tax=Chitinophaga solisilvae TaxID=1233460 RepID=A0A3S1JID1_9BACT|nr:glycosyl transferase [Chitinophaga solisilvae]